MRAVEALQRELETRFVDEEVDEVDKEREEDMSRLREKKLGRLGGRPKASEALVALGDRPAKRVEGSVKKRIEFGVYEKLDICKYIDQAKQSHPKEKALWAECRQKFGISVQSLKEIYVKKDQWGALVKKHGLGKKRGQGKGKRKRPKNARVRAPGGGRKREFDQQIKDLKHWIEMERSNGHFISKRELLLEFCTRLDQLAQECANKAAKDENQQRAASWRKESENAIKRKKKLLDPNTSTGRNYVEKLIDWTSSKFTQKELSHQLSPLEAKVRAQLTWQHIDRVLYMMLAAPLEVLEKEDIVNSPSEVVASRDTITITMSDQVPLWAKAQQTKMIWSDKELAGLRYEEHKGMGMSDLRREMQAAQDALTSKQQIIHGDEGESSGKKAIAGMKTMRHSSTDEKYRITMKLGRKSGI